MASPVLSVNHVVKTFGAKRAVDDATLDVMPGDIFGFVGHNGAGKTTLIRSIAVSYTHLDVYKRQARHHVGGCRRGTLRPALRHHPA